MRGISRRLLLPQERDVTFLSLVLFWMTTKVPKNDAAVLMHSELITHMDVQKLPFFKKKYLFDSTYFSRYTKLDILKKKLH